MLLITFFFALAIAIQTYFQKIADPADIAATAGVSFTINHIAAVVMPAVSWLYLDYVTRISLYIGSCFIFLLTTSGYECSSSSQARTRSRACDSF